MSKLISYAQNFEDVMLWRAFSHVPNGCYVDVGAQSPDTDSVSRMFYEHGWRGVHVEPTPQYATLLREKRPDEVVLQVAVSDQPGILQFFNIEDTGLSTTDPVVAARHRDQGFRVSDIRVPAVTLDTVLAQVADTPVHWLKIDVEGAEALVIAGWGAGGARPWVVVIESTRPLSPEQSHEQWEAAVLEHGYEFVYFDGLNRFYVSREHPELKSAFAAGPNVFDDFWLSSSSQFCGLVNTGYAELQAAAELQRETLVGELEAGKEQHVQLEAGLQAHYVQLEAELQVHHVQLEAELQVRHVQMEAELQARYFQLEAELQMHAAELERQRNEHALALNAMAESQQRLVAGHAKVLADAAEVSRQQISGLVEQVDAGKQESHRWWLAHEQLLVELNAIKRSRSWQLTGPFRAMRRRLSASALGRLKRTLRPMTLRMLKIAVASPGLRRVTKPVVERIPFLYNRLHALAVQEHLFEIERQRLAVLEGKEREHEVVYLDKRAARVLADLKHSRNGKAEQ